MTLKINIVRNVPAVFEKLVGEKIKIIVRIVGGGEAGCIFIISLVHYMHTGAEFMLPVFPGLLRSKR